MRQSGDFGNTLELSHGDSLEGLSIADALTNPEAVIDKYKTQAMQMGTQLVILQAAVFSIMVYLIFRNTKVRGTQK